MTLEQIQKLRGENFYKFCQLVQEKVHGGSANEVAVSRYHADANADLESHGIACQWIDREKYPDDYWYDYMCSLTDMWMFRKYGRKMNYNGIGPFPLIQFYQIGDYSAAALAVVLAHTQTTERS